MAEVQAAKVTIPVVTNADSAAVSMGRLDKSLDKIDKTSQGTTKSFSALNSGVIALGIGATAGITALGSAAIKGAAALEQNQIAFSTMLKSADKANTLIAQFREMAAKTPFETTDIIDSGKALLAYGFASGEVTKTLQDLGNIAAGSGNKLRDIAAIYGKIRLGQNLYAEDLNQLSDRGIPVIKELAKVLGVSETSIKKLASEGKVSFTALQKAFKNMTSTGGIYAGMMEAQSKSLLGLWSTFKSLVLDSATALGTFFMPVIKEVLPSLIETASAIYQWLSNTANLNAVLEETKTVLKAVAITAGVLATGYIAVYTVQKSMLALQWVKYLWLMRAAILKNITLTNLWAGAQWLLNKALTANPIGLIIAGIAALGVAIYYLIKNWEKVKYTVQYFSLYAQKELLKIARSITINLVEKMMDYFKIMSKLPGVGQAYKLILLTQIANANALNDEITLIKGKMKVLDTAHNKRIKQLDKEGKKDKKTMLDAAKSAAAATKSIKKAKSELQKMAEAVSDIGGRVVSTFTAIGAAVAASQQAQINAIDATMQAELKAAGVADQTTREQAQKEYDIAVATGTALEIEEKRRALVKAQIEEKYLKKKQDLEYKAAMTAWAFQLTAATASGAMAVLNAVAAGAKYGIAGMIAFGALATATAGANIAAVAAAKPQPPTAQYGGSFMVNPGNQADSGLLRVNQGERVDVTPVSKSKSGGKQEQILMIDGQSFKGYLIDQMNKIANSGDFRITRQGAVKTA